MVSGERNTGTPASSSRRRAGAICSPPMKQQHSGTRDSAASRAMPSATRSGCTIASGDRMTRMAPICSSWRSASIACR